MVTAINDNLRILTETTDDLQAPAQVPLTNEDGRIKFFKYIESLPDTTQQLWDGKVVLDKIHKRYVVTIIAHVSQNWIEGILNGWQPKNVDESKLKALAKKIFSEWLYVKSEGWGTISEKKIDGDLLKSLLIAIDGKNPVVAGQLLNASQLMAAAIDSLVVSEEVNGETKKVNGLRNKIKKIYDKGESLRKAAEEKKRSEEELPYYNPQSSVINTAHLLGAVPSSPEIFGILKSPEKKTT